MKRSCTLRICSSTFPDISPLLHAMRPDSLTLASLRALGMISLRKEKRECETENEKINVRMYVRKRKRESVIDGVRVQQ